MKILLAMDASPASQAAVDQVSSRPWPAGSQVEVITVIEMCEPWALSEIVQELQSASNKLVNDAANRLRSSGLNAIATVARGNSKTAILDHASNQGADLIVVGAHGLGALERFLLGGVSRALLRHAPCSIEIVRKPAARSDGLKVLLAVDGSEGARHAAESVAARPWPAGTEIRVLSAVEMELSAWQAAFEVPLLDSARLETQRAEAMRRTEEAIEAARKILEDAGLQTSQSISVLVASPKEVILQEAAAWPADLIVLGSHGNGALERFMLGSTSEAVATHASCSVEVIRRRA